MQMDRLRSLVLLPLRPTAATFPVGSKAQKTELPSETRVAGATATGGAEGRARSVEACRLKSDFFRFFRVKPSMATKRKLWPNRRSVQCDSLPRVLRPSLWRFYVHPYLPRVHFVSDAA